MALEALIFDVDGTLAETEEMHRQAFNDAFASEGLQWNWSQSLYKELLRVTGGKERILHYVLRWHAQDLPAVESLIPRIYAIKTKRYQELVRQGDSVLLRPGVARLIEEATSAGVRLAIATTTSRSNVDALLQRTLPPCGETLFNAIVAGDEVATKKPDPEAYEAVLRQLCLPACACVAFEDSTNGVIAALRAGLSVVATPAAYTSDDDFTGAVSVVSTLGDPGRTHRHIAGWKWSDGVVTLAALQARYEKISG